MTSLAIIGGGRGAALHADAALHTRGVELIGVGGRPGTAGLLSEQAGVPDLALADACRADALVVAVPQEQTGSVLAAVEAEIGEGAPLRALLVEAPVPPTLAPSRPSMLGANLLHAPLVRRGLRAIAAMQQPHHVHLRVRVPQSRDRSAGGVLAAGLRAAPLLLAAVAEPATRIRYERRNPDHLVAVLTFASGRTARLDAAAADLSAVVELEVADANGVVNVTCDPLPRLELDGTPQPADEEYPLAALGFVDQIHRLARVATGDAEPWLPLDVGTGLTLLFDPPAG